MSKKKQRQKYERDPIKYQGEFRQPALAAMRKHQRKLKQYCDQIEMNAKIISIQLDGRPLEGYPPSLETSLEERLESSLTTLQLLMQELTRV